MYHASEDSSYYSLEINRILLFKRNNLYCTNMISAVSKTEAKKLIQNFESTDEYMIPLLVHLNRFKNFEILTPEIKYKFDNYKSNNKICNDLLEYYHLIKQYENITYTTYSLSFNFEKYPYDYSSTHYFALDNGYYPPDYDLDNFDAFSKNPIDDIIRYCSNPPCGFADGVQKEYDLLFIYIQEHKFDDWCDTIGDDPDQIYERVGNTWKPKEIYKGEPINFH